MASPRGAGGLDSHDADATTQDDPTRWCPTQRKSRPTNWSWPQWLATTGPWSRSTPTCSTQYPPRPGQAVLIANADHARLTADLGLWAAESTPEAAHATQPGRAGPAAPGSCQPGQQVLDIQTEISQAIAITEFTTATGVARYVAIRTGCARQPQATPSCLPVVDRQR